MSVVVFQLLMIGVFFLKEMWYPGVLVIPILVLTIIYWWFMRTEYKKHGDKLVVSEAANTETAEKNFLEVNYTSILVTLSQCSSLKFLE